jgi:hypothetical protein
MKFNKPTKRSMFPRGKGNKPTGRIKGLAGEDLLQSNFCVILDLLRLPYYSIPNGVNKQSKFIQWLFKVTGLKPGVPDLHIPQPVFGKDGETNLFGEVITKGSLMPSLKYLSLYIETKTKTGVVSAEQKKWHTVLRQIGHRVEVVRSTEALELLLLDCYPEHATRFAHLLKLQKLKNNNGTT